MNRLAVCAISGALICSCAGGDQKPPEIPPSHYDPKQPVVRFFDLREWLVEQKAATDYPLQPDTPILFYADSYREAAYFVVMHRITGTKRERTVEARWQGANCAHALRSLLWEVWATDNPRTVDSRVKLTLAPPRPRNRIVRETPFDRAYDTVASAFISFPPDYYVEKHGRGCESISPVALTFDVDNLKTTDGFIHDECAVPKDCSISVSDSNWREKRFSIPLDPGCAYVTHASTIINANPVKDSTANIESTDKWNYSVIADTSLVGDTTGVSGILRVRRRDLFGPGTSIGVRSTMTQRCMKGATWEGPNGSVELALSHL